MNNEWKYSPSLPSKEGWYEVCILFIPYVNDEGSEVQTMSKVMCNAYYNDDGWRLFSFDSRPFIVAAWRDIEDIECSIPTSFVDIDIF